MSESREGGIEQPASNPPSSAPEAESGAAAADAPAGQASDANGYQGEFFTEAPPTPQMVKAAARGRKPSPLIFVGFALLAAVMLALVLLHHSDDAPSSDSQDMGEGIYKAAGLRGHMLARWDGKLHYQVQIEPIDPTVASSFDFTLNNLPRPIDITLRLLDSSGFALCQKTVLLPYEPAKALAPPSAAHPPSGKAALARYQQEQAARQAQIAQLQAQEQTRLKGQDVLQRQVNSDGQIVALNAQGDFPCDRKSFKHVDYWDMTTNFPTLDEQQALMNHQAQHAAQQSAEARRATRLANVRRFGSAFYVQGDEHVSSYDASRALLTTNPGRNFYIARKQDQAIVATWAANYVLIHYKCDQQASCALTHSGTPGVVFGKLNQ